MAKCICKLCGATAISKCPCCRSVFPSNSTDAMLSHVLKHRFEQDGGLTWLKISWLCVTENDPVKNLYGLYRQLKNVFELPDFLPPEQLLCEHVWSVVEGEKTIHDM